MAEERKDSFAETVDTAASAAHTVKSAIKAGKAISGAAKGAAAGGPYCLCFDDNQQYHFSGGKVLVKDWLYRNFPREDKEFLKQQYRAIPEIGKLMRRIPEELRRASVFKILFYHYYNFDLDQPFLPQYEQNNRSLLHDLRQLALLD